MTLSKNKLVSIIIPAYNEEDSQEDCLKTLNQQTYEPIEIILVDDGSTDETVKIAKKFKVMLLSQSHKGPGVARNLGASKAKGEILVFADSDMTFDRNFIKDLIKPITDGKTIGTFSKNEMVANKFDTWSICWNINRNLPPARMHPQDYPNKGPVFRAILKKEFDKVGGFDTTGEYTDDWSLSRKLGVEATAVNGALYYHTNPSGLQEVFRQARWIGKNKFISGSFVRKIRSLIFYSLPFSIVIALYKSIINYRFSFLIFKLVYDFGIWLSVIKSFFGEPKSK